MNQERLHFMSFPRCPGRFTSEEAGWYLGFSTHDIPVLVSHKLLKPLGSPPQNGTRYFSLPELERARLDAKWLDRASATLVRHWKKKNQKRKPKRPDEPTGER
jgi:hypothetical protein